MWLINGAEQFASDPEVSHALLLIAKHRDTRKCLVLLGAILEAPELVERLSEVLKPAQTPPAHRDGARKRAGRERIYELGNVLSDLLHYRSDAERCVVCRRQRAFPAPAFPSATRSCGNSSCWSRPCGSQSRGPEMPLFNFATFTAFLAWFGGTGYLLTRHSGLIVTVIVLLATLAGFVGAAIIFWFIVKFLLTHDQALDPADYERVGVLGPHQQRNPRRRHRRDHLLSRRNPADVRRAERNGEALARGTEVVVTRYEHGIAYVRRWEEMAKENGVDTSRT